MSEARSSPQQGSKELRLSTKGLANAATLGIEDFTLRVGEHSVACSRFEASFLSPRITTAILSDATLSEYDLELGDPGRVNLSCLSDLLSLSRAGSVVVDSSNLMSITAVAKCLENQELCEQLIEFARGRGELALSNVSERLSVAESLGVSRLPEIEYLASHCYEIDVDLLRTLSHSCLREVLASDELQVDSEDALLESILALGDDCLEFLGNVRSEYLTVSGIDRFLNTISIDEVNGELWSSLCRRLRLSVEPISSLESPLHGVTLKLDTCRPFDGIVSWLSRQCGGCVHMRGSVSVTASNSGGGQAHQIVDYNGSQYWFSGDTPNSWIQFDFKDRRVFVTDYSIKSAGHSSHHLLQWSLAGSNDGKSWTLLDERNTRDLDGNYIVKSYGCSFHRPSPSRFVRLTQTRQNSSGGHTLMLSNLEFFGSVYRQRRP